MPENTARTFGLEDTFEEAEEAYLVDPDVADGDDLSAIAAELTAAVVPTIDLAVPTRPGWVLRCRANFGAKAVDGYRKAAADKRFTDKIDGGKMSALVIGANTVAILRNGVEVNVDGKPATFATPAFRQALGADSVATAVRTVYGLDGHLEAAALRLMTEAGYGDEAIVSDPTQ